MIPIVRSIYIVDMVSSRYKGSVSFNTTHQLSCSGTMGMVRYERCDAGGRKVAMGAREMRLGQQGDRV